MATTPQPEDQFSRYSTFGLVQDAFRITPKHEHDNWVATSEGAWDYPEAELRAFVIEQLEDYGLTVNDINTMHS